VADQYITRDAWLFRAGTYADKGVNATPALLDSLVTQTNASPSHVPMDLEHGPTERVLDFGRLVPGSLRRVTGAPPRGEQGEWIVGQVEVDPEIERRLKVRGLSVTFPRTLDAITKIAVTSTPRVTGAQFSSEAGEVLTFAEGYLMPETPVSQIPPEAPAVDTQGLVAGIVAGVSGAIKGLFGKTEPAADPEVAPAFSMADVEAMLAKERAAHDKETAEIKATADAAKAEAIEQKLKTFSAELVRDGVPQVAVDRLAPFAVGKTKAAITFSSDGKTETREVGIDEAARETLFAMRGMVPMSRILPSDDNREVSFADSVKAQADELRKADPKLSPSAAYERAALEVK
jgi:hypothetical protein